jgi:signal peptidase II
LTALVAGADQFIKYEMMKLLAPGAGQALIPGILSLVMWHNPGAAFGSLGGWAYSRWFLAGMALAAIGVALWLLRSPSGRRTSVAVCLGLVTGGAVGNLVDRIRLGWVVDYILVYYGSWYWPAFNLADMGITLGGFTLLIFLWRGGKGRRK